LTLRAFADLIIGVHSAGNLPHVSSGNWIWRYAPQDRRVSVWEIQWL